MSSILNSVSYVEKTKDGVRHILNAPNNIGIKYAALENQIHGNALGDARIAQAVDTFMKGGPTYHVTERFIHNGGTYKATVKELPAIKRVLNILRVVK